MIPDFFRDPTEDFFDCIDGKIGNDTVYMCDRFDEDGQLVKFGIRFLGNRGEFYCGEFRHGAPYGKGYEVSYNENDDDYLEVCGNFNDGIREGYSASYFYNGNSMRQGSYLVKNIDERTIQSHHRFFLTEWTCRRSISHLLG